MPLVSIAMPIRNCEGTLAVAVQSLLNQTFPDWELLLIDDGSTDTTVAIARKFADARIRIFVDGNNLGLPARLNQAIDLTQARYLARMDGDDVAYPQRLERQVDFLLSNPDTDLVGSNVLVFDSTGRSIGKRHAPVSHSEICSKPMSGFPIAHPTYLGRVDWFRYHKYNRQMLKAQDQELLFRTHCSSKFANVPEILLGYREDHIGFFKILSSRRYFARALLEFGHKEGLSVIFLPIARLILKTVVDSLAISSRLKYRLLRHRALPITREEDACWNRYWQQLSVEVAQYK